LLRVCADSSVLGGCRDVGFQGDSLRLIEWARQRKLTLLISEITLRELEAAPPEVKDILTGLPLDCWEFVPLTTEIQRETSQNVFYFRRSSLELTQRNFADQ
jgi:hypothetical protein